MAMMLGYAYGVAVLCTLAALPALASPPFTLSLDLPLEADQFVALRFNLTGDNDVRLGQKLITCTSEGDSARSLYGAVDWIILDREPAISSANPGFLSWTVPESKNDSIYNSEIARANVAGHSFEGPINREKESCGGIHDGWFGYGLGDAREVSTHVLISMAARGRYYFNATWSYGVESWDVYVGNAIVKTHDDFGRSIHAAAYPYGPHVGALQREVFQPTGDMVGYFAPAYYRPGLVRWSCTEDGISCPPGTFTDMIDVYAEPHSTWDLRVNADVAVDQIPYYMLALAPLPDDTYTDDPSVSAR
jgi:hypothetical protein